MSFTSKPKRKNDDPPRFPAWVVVAVALGLVIVAFLLFRPAASTTDDVPTPENIEATASAIIQQASQTAQGITDPLLLTATALIEQATAGVQSSGDDPLLLTATALIQQATQGASNTDLDPFVLTATAIVQQATDMASTPAP